MPALPRLVRWTSVASALVGATALAIAVQGGRWWSVGEVAIGPAGSHHCFDGDCRPGGLAWIGGGDVFMRSGMATFAACVIAGLVLIALAAAAAAGRVPRLAAKTTIVAGVTAGLAGGVFIATYPGVPGAGVDLGLVCFVVGVTASLVAATLVLRARVPSVA